MDRAADAQDEVHHAEDEHDVASQGRGGLDVACARAMSGAGGQSPRPAPSRGLATFAAGGPIGPPASAAPAAAAAAPAPVAAAAVVGAARAGATAASRGGVLLLLGVQALLLQGLGAVALHGADPVLVLRRDDAAVLVDARRQQHVHATHVGILGVLAHGAFDLVQVPDQQLPPAIL